jgi:(+)-trans-carveol dehydrogenase
MTGRVEGKGRFHYGCGSRAGPQPRVETGAGGRGYHRHRYLRAISRSSEIPASTPDDLAETADLVKAQNRRIVTTEVDVHDYDTLRAAVDNGVEQLGRVDIIVANAGIGNGGATLDKNQ